MTMYLFFFIVAVAVLGFAVFLAIVKKKRPTLVGLSALLIGPTLLGMELLEIRPFGSWSSLIALSWIIVIDPTVLWKQWNDPSYRELSAPDSGTVNSRDPSP